MSTEKIDFGKLFELNGKAVRRALRRYGGPRMPVEDGLQEVFKIALEEYSADRPADAWLIKTAYHVARNWRRLARHDREVPGVEADAVDDHSPDYWFTAWEEWHAIHHVIDTLDEELREVFVLAEIEKTPLRKIAAALNLPLWTVNYRLHRARDHFFEEGRRRRAAGLLGVLALLNATESRSKAAGNQYLQNAGWALFGGAVVAALFQLTRPASAPIPIHAEPPELSVIADTRSILLPAPPVRDAPQPASQDVVPASSLPQPSRASPRDGLLDQLTLIDAATQAIDQGRYREALHLLERAPDGPMSAERDRLVATSKLGIASKRTH